MSLNRPPPQPDRRAITGDEQPERRVVHHPGVDGADQPAPKRTGTLTGMPAAATQRAPALWGKTVMRPAPPSAKAKARRSDAPPASASLPSVDAATGQPGAVAELERQLAEAQAQIDRLQRPAFPPPVSERPRVPAPPPVPASVPPSGWSDPRVIKAVLALVGALTALGTPLGIWLTAKATAGERAAERQAEVAKDATQTASSAKAESRDVAKELDEFKKQWAAERAYNREVLRRLGVQVPKRPGDPEPPVLDTQTPVRKPGTVTPLPVLVVTTPPP